MKWGSLHVNSQSRRPWGRNLVWLFAFGIEYKLRHHNFLLYRLYWSLIIWALFIHKVGFIWSPKGPIPLKFMVFFCYSLLICDWLTKLCLKYSNLNFVMYCPSGIWMLLVDCCLKEYIPLFVLYQFTLNLKVHDLGSEYKDLGTKFPLLNSSFVVYLK